MKGSEPRERGTAHGAAPRLYTIPPTDPFLDVLAQAILAGEVPHAEGTPPDQLALSRTRILLPTRRACRAMQDAFLRVSGGDALLLPSIQPLGDVDDEAEFFAPVDGGLSSGDAGLALPAAIGDMERQLAMTKLVLAWCRSSRAGGTAGAPDLAATTPAQAVLLARELLRLLDAVDSEQADLGRLAALAPERFASHWQLTVEFLEIVTEHWPKHLAERGLMSPYARRDALMAAETKRLARELPKTPVIAAGSTGSVPATAALLDVIARLPSGCVVLPGLDTDLDDESWLLLGAENPEHPQYGMARLLDHLGATRDDVGLLGGAGDTPTSVGRLRLVSEVMRPAQTTDKWNASGGEIEPACLDGLTVVETPSAEVEAELVALLLRHAAESDSDTAALVTPDRGLARRVSSRLEKWRLRIDDSAGQPLARTPPGVFLDLIAETLDTEFAPVALLGLLKHPLTRLGRPASGIRHAARMLELTGLRQPHLDTGLASIRAAVERIRGRAEKGEARGPVLRRLAPEDWQAALRLLDDVERIFAIWTESVGQPEAATVKTLFRKHLAIAEALASGEDGQPSSLWQGEAGEALAIQAADLLSSDAEGPGLSRADYPEFYRSLFQGAVIRPRRPGHPRLFIWGPLEARLQQADLVIVAGLNEGSWPRLEDPDPWLSGPMRQAIGLPPLERRVGLAAHDVAQLMAAPRVVLTRATKVDGVPTVPSRWLLRLQTLLRGAGLEGALEPRHPWLAWARQRDNAERYTPVAMPAPRPPVAARPRRLSVTRIEDWIASPYNVYARDILRLAPLEPLSGEPDAALRGQLIHEALNRFARAHPDRLPADIAPALTAIAMDVFQEFGGHTRIRAFWLPQFGRFARWFAETEPDRRRDVLRTVTEVDGRLEIDAPGGPFRLTARADRIDLTGSGALVIYDYKTGALPSMKQVGALMTPQLPLEAAIAARGGFADFAAGKVAALRYVRVVGTGEAGEERAAAREAPDDLAAEALSRLGELVARFDDAGTPYAPLRRPGFDSRYRYDDYAHLARIGEWASGDGAED